MKLDPSKISENRKIAVIDTGSNTIRLAVFSVTSRNEINGKLPQIKELFDVKIVAGLSAYVKDNVFSDLGVDKASRVLKAQITRAKNLGCDDINIFATAVLRNASNSKNAIEKIEASIGKKIDLLSTQDEAKLGIAGACFKNDISQGCLIDLGGGSCEISSFNDTNFETCSLDIGCVSAYSTYVKCLLPKKNEYLKIREKTKSLIKKKEAPLKKNKNLYAIGGSVRAISKLTREIKELKKTPRHIWKSDIKDIKDLYFSDQDKFAHLAVKATPDRLHSLLPGLAIIEEIMETSNCSTIDICRGGIREGYLLSLLNL